MSDPVDLVWQMGMASLSFSGNEIRVPLSISKTMAPADIAELRNRLSQKFNGAKTFVYPDEYTQTLRICTVTESFGSGSSPASVDCSTISSAVSPASPPEDQSPTQANGKKSKVPRPPNAFILYRKHWHETIKRENPRAHNNQISVIIGKKWKAEGDEVKEVYKHQAEKIKLKHAVDYPGYQYAPRKPSEKKRRMTARKLAEAAKDVPGITAAVQNTVTTVPGNGLSAQQTLPSFIDMLGLNTPVNNNATFGICQNPEIRERTNLSFSLPTINNQSIKAFKDANADAVPKRSLEMATEDRQIANAHGEFGANNFFNNLGAGVELEFQNDIDLSEPLWDPAVNLETIADQLPPVVPGHGPFQFDTELAADTGSVHDFLNSLIDWDAVRDSFKISVDPENDRAIELAQNNTWDNDDLDEMDDILPYFSALDEGEFGQFSAELDRLSTIAP